MAFAPYSPQGQLTWAHSRDVPQTQREVDCYRYNERLNVRKDGKDELEWGSKKLHTQLALSQRHRSLCYNEGLRDITDAVSELVLSVDFCRVKSFRSLA